MMHVSVAKDNAVSGLIDQCQTAIDRIDDLILGTEIFSESDLEHLGRVKMNLGNRITLYTAALSRG